LHDAIWNTVNLDFSFLNSHADNLHHLFEVCGQYTNKHLILKECKI